MEFIVDNLVWFIVGGVVILMTIVGYMAEKTDFASKKYREKVGQESETKKNKKGKKDKKNDDAPVVPQEVLPTNDVGLADIVNKKSEENSTVKEEDLSVPINNSTDVPTDKNIVTPENESPVNEDLAAPISDMGNSAANQGVGEAISTEPVLTNDNQILTDTSSNTPITNEVITPVVEPIAQAPVTNDVSLPVTDNVTPIINTTPEQANEVVSEDLYAPIAENTTVGETIEPVVSETINTPIVQNPNIPSISPVAESGQALNVGVQEIVPTPIENINNDAPVMTNEINTNIENNNIEGTAPQQNTEIVNQTSEIFDVPSQNVVAPVSEPETTDFEKIFPENPIIIDNKNNENIQVTATPENVASPDDIWKF